MALLLGQALSLLLCGTGVTAQLLEQDHSLSVPTTQAFVNYTLLGAVFGVSWATTKNFLTIVRQNWWKYLLLGVVDLEANYLVILAYKYTNLTSVQVGWTSRLPTAVIPELFTYCSVNKIKF